MVKKSERLSIVALIAIATLILSGSPSSAAIPGSNCPKIGATMSVGGYRYSCVKSAGKLVWNSGSKIQAAKKVASKPAKVSCTALQISSANDYIANRNDLIRLYNSQLSDDSNSAQQAVATGNYVGATQFRQSMQMDQSNIARANTQISSVRQFIQGNCADESLIAGL